MNQKQFIALVDAAHEILHARQREAFAAYDKDKDRPQLQQELHDASRAYAVQIGLRP